ncbi:hypothetical protein A3731_23135 [Roseovarius sp. HI0049]|nr:hypothetical protein A3731_23135 [Roseovarius sp. HI0049]
MTKLKLEVPISHGGRTIRAVRIRRIPNRYIPKLCRAAEGDAFGFAEVAVALMTRLPEEVVGEFDAADFKRLALMLDRAIPKKLTTR